MNPPSRVRYGVLAALCSLAFLTYLDRVCIMQVAPDLARDLHFGHVPEGERAGLTTAEAANLAAGYANRRLAWVFTAFLVGYTIFEVPGGWLGDRWGPRRVIVALVLWWSAFTALTGWADRLLTAVVPQPGPDAVVLALVAVRFLFGLGEAGAFPNLSRALARWFPFAERGAAQGIVWMASRLGGAVAPPIIQGLRWATDGWRSAFGLLGLAGVAWAWWFGRWFRDRPEDHPAVNPEEVAAIRAGAAAGSVYDDAGHHPLDWRRLLSPNLLALYGAGAAISFCWYFYVTFLPKYLEDTYRFSPQESWFLTGLPLLAGAPSCLLGGRLSDWLIRRTGSRRWGRSLPCVFGYAAAGLLALTMPYLADPYTFIAMACLICACQDLAVPCIWSVAADVGGRYAGTVSGAMNTAGGVGGALSPLAAAGLMAHEGGWLFFVYAAVYAAGALLWLAIDATATVTEAA